MPPVADNASAPARPPLPPEFDLALPIAHYVKEGVSSRTGFWRWEKMGLRILKVGGKRLLRLSELNRFLNVQDAKGREVAA